MEEGRLQMLHKGLTLAICVALLLKSSGLGSDALNGVPNSATRPNVTPTNGSPALENSTTSHSISLDVFENSLLFGNQAVFQALTQHPLTAGSLTDTSSATYPLWSDPMSILPCPISGRMRISNGTIWFIAPPS